MGLAILASLPGAVSQGLIWGIMALGVYVTFKILDYADLTVDGSLVTGGAVSAVLIVAGVHPLVSLLGAILAGMLCGLITGFLHTKLEIPAILSGILTQIGLYSINLRLMGRASIPLVGTPAIVSLSEVNWSIAIGLIFAIVVIGILYWFFGTEMGCAIRATGNNANMVRAQGVNTDTMKIIGLVISNGLVGLSGGLLAQYQGFANVNTGRGAIVIGLAAVIIGEVVFGNRFNFAYRLGATVGGSIIYYIVISIVLQMGLNTDDMKLLTATVVAFALALPVLKRKFFKAKRPVKIADNAAGKE